MSRSASHLVLLVGSLLSALASPSVLAWGDAGHQIVALIADHYLEPVVRQKVVAILAGDETHLVADQTIASEANWAARYRDSDRDTTKVRYNATQNWHYVNIELSTGDFDAGCFGHPVLPERTLASMGAAEDCITDKIEQFAAELHDPGISSEEKRVALQFLLHLIGDLHQPLHASDDQDQGGNSKQVTDAGIPNGSLHHYWDTEFLKRLGTRPGSVAKRLVASVSAAQVAAWSEGTPAIWAVQSYELAKLRAYGGLGAPDASGTYHLSASYVTSATQATSRQLARAGVRLAQVLNDALRER